MSERAAGNKPERDNEAVRQFFDRWHLYKKIADHDYLNHRGAYAAVARLLRERTEPFSFLELGCGDARWTSEALAGTQLRSYEAMDLSTVALDLARENLRNIGCGARLMRGDFYEELPRRERMDDVIFIGLSLHHLPRREKETFFPVVRRRLNAGGSFIFYEPIRRTDESREEVLARCCALARATWTELSAEELEQTQRHITECDYPEPAGEYLRMSREAGFRGGEVRYVDPHELYAVIACEC